MIIDFNRYNGGGGSGSGVTPQEVQRQIDSALTPYWDSAITESAITEAVSGLATEQYVQDAISGVNLDNYWTSAQTEDAISAATSGKADAANVTPYSNRTLFPTWNSQGIITGVYEEARNKTVKVNGNIFRFYSSEGFNLPDIYTPRTAGNAGDILVSVGAGAPVWSAVTGPDMSLYTPTSGFSTINGSAITNGGNIVIQGGGDMSNYWNSAETKSYVDSAATNLQNQLDTIDNVIPAAILDLNQKKVESQDVRYMVKLTQSDYDQLVLDDDVDPDTFYIIVNSI